MTTDAVLSDLVYDLQIATNGDIQTADFFDTSILMSLYCERRATSSEVPESERRRGWIGNESTPGFEIGSKLWLYEQARVTRTTLNGVESAVLSGLQWMVDDGIATNVSTAATLSSGKITIEAIIERPSSQVDRRYYELWQGSGVT